MVEKKDWPELKKIAQERGLKIVEDHPSVFVCRETGSGVEGEFILLPFGKIKDIEYGVGIGLGLDSPRPYMIKDDRLEFGRILGSSFTHFSRTEKPEKIDEVRYLILNFNPKSLDSIQQDRLEQVFDGLAHFLPDKIAKEPMRRYWEGLKEFAQEQGFEVRNNKILLPLGQIEDYEYGIMLKPLKKEKSSDRFHTSWNRFGFQLPANYVLNLKTDRLKSNEGGNECYTHEYVIRTAELGDEKFVIDAEQKGEVNKFKGLMWAFKFKDLGTIDPTYLGQAYSETAKLLPKKLAKKLMLNKISELEEKLEEIDSFASQLPEDEIRAIKGNIREEVENYYLIADVLGIKLAKGKVKQLIESTISELEKKIILTIKEDGYGAHASTAISDFLHWAGKAQEIGIVPDVEFPTLAKETCMHFIYHEKTPIDWEEWSISEFMTWYRNTGNGVKLQDLSDFAKTLVKERYYEMLLNQQFSDIDALQEVTSIEPVFDTDDVLRYAREKDRYKEIRYKEIYKLDSNRTAIETLRRHYEDYKKREEKFEKYKAKRDDQ